MVGDEAGKRVLVAFAPQHRPIFEMVEERSRVLDLGCGSGELLHALVTLKGVRGEGIELSEECIQTCVAKGLRNIHHSDLDEGLADYADKSVDYVILTDTLQVLHHPLFLMREMARVGRKCIVSFPNFGHWSARVQLALRGHMPKTRSLPFEWYETPNIHLTTMADFYRLCRDVPVRVLKGIGVHGDDCRRARLFPNLLAERGVFLVEDPPRESGAESPRRLRST